MTLDVQFMTIITMVLGGFYLGTAHDTFRRFSIHWRQRTLLMYTLEISFWLIQTLVLFYLLFLVNNGELRFYVFLAVLLGYAAYQALAAPLFKRILERMIYLVKAVWHFVNQVGQALVVTPVKWLVHVLAVFILFLLRLISSICLFLLKLIYFPLRWTCRLAYRCVPKRMQKNLDKISFHYSKIKHNVIKWMKNNVSKWR
ncbi:MAG TPA: spore cortex biosynthesis protein YabQ [Bacillota bacterium]|nr:spore cortex biosynthesis protein YabQ [Bacillota bacterium]